MATTPVIEEYITELARAIGNAYDAVNDGVGDENTPGTALFEVAQLRDLASGNLPRFGILSAQAPPFAVTMDTNSSFVRVSGGQVGYQGQVLAVAPQRVSLARTFFSTYPSTYQYGVRLGFPLAEAAKATQVYVTTVSQDAAAGSLALPVSNISLPVSLGFPLQAYIGTAFVAFSGLDATGTMLKVDPGFNRGVLPTAFSAGTSVNFQVSPRVMAVYGLPVIASGNNPATFSYYPIMPPDWLPIADILVTNPASPAVVIRGGGNLAINSTALIWPAPSAASPLFSTADSVVIVNACDSARTALRQVAAAGGVGDVISALEQYTNAISNSTTTSFSAYWASQPFRATSFFARGVSFAGLERLEFPDSFCRAYYASQGTDLQHTFALFRGNLYSSVAPLAGSAPANVYLHSYQSGVAPSSFNRGGYTYGVSAVNANGETAPHYGGIVATSNDPVTFLNEIQYDIVSGAQFYHIYRLSTQAGDISEYRITSDGQVTGSGKFSTASVVPNSDMALSSLGEAYKLVASSGTQLGGIQIQLKATTLTITNTTDAVTVALYSDNAGIPGTLLATGTQIPYGALTTSYQTFISQLDHSLTFGTSYWVVLSRTASPLGGAVQLYAQSVGTAQTASSADLTTWTMVNSVTAWIQPLGFLDNNRHGTFLTRRGIMLTGKTALVPRRISVYVPPLIPLNDNIPVVSNLPPADTNGFVTRNDLNVTVTAQNGAAGSPTVLTITVPKGTPRDTRFLLGTASQLFDRVTDVYVTPGTNLTTGAYGMIQWSDYDFITVETMP